MQKLKLAIIIVISLLTVATISLSIGCYMLLGELREVKSKLQVQETSQKASVFANLFVNKILLSTGTVNFEDRLKLENAVRDLNDPEIVSKWQKFTDSNGDAETQTLVGDILILLLNKITPQT